MLVLYLSNKYVRAVRGKVSGGRVRIDKICETRDSFGCIQSGEVKDEELFLNLMRKFWKENALPKRDVYLVLGGSQFATKTIQVPVQRRDRMIGYVRRDFSGMERFADPVYGYYALPGQGKEKKKVQEVFAVTAPREYIRGYRDLFHKMGVSVVGVEPAISAMRNLQRVLPQLREATGIVQIVDDMTIFNALLVDGEYVYTSRNRLYSDPGTVGYPVEVARAVSNILQFARAQDITAEIRMVWVSGLSGDELAIYNDSIMMINQQLNPQQLNPGDGLSLPRDSGEKLEVPGMVLALSALRKVDLRTNLVSQMSKNYEKEEARGKWSKAVLPVAALAVLMGGVTAWYGYEYFSLTSQLKEARRYNNRQDVLTTCMEYDTTDWETALVLGLSDSLAAVEEKNLSYPRVDSAVRQAVDQCAEGVAEAAIRDYNSLSGTMGFYTEADNVGTIHEYIARLEAEKQFAHVDYTGYVQRADGAWDVQVKCQMAGREAEADNAETDGER